MANRSPPVTVGSSFASNESKVLFSPAPHGLVNLVPSFYGDSLRRSLLIGRGSLPVYMPAPFLFIIGLLPPPRRRHRRTLEE